MSKTAQRIGIYAGTFNPVHSGHIAFALQAMQAAGLDKLYFLPERRPRHKRHVEHFGHRVAMLNRAVLPHPQLDVLELDDVDFTVNRTLPKLEAMFGGDQLVFLFGSDVAEHMTKWDKLERLFITSELVIGLRTGQDTRALKRSIVAWPVQPLNLRIIDSHAPDVSSHGVRQALRKREPTKGLLASVARYSNHHWLYVSLA
jgi:nicotinate-nucleotide adenylyltransferase